MISMSNSIQQIANKLASKILDYAKEGNITDLDQMAAAVFQDCKMCSLEMIRVLTDHMNLVIREDKAGRKQNGLLLKEKNRERTVLMKLGSFTYERDYFYDRYSGEYRCLLDEVLGIEKYERIGPEVSANLVAEATMHSYEQSAKHVAEAFAIGEKVSKQTVKRKIQETASLEKEAVEKKEGVSTLHIYADEDHVSLQKRQKEKGKKNQYLPLVTVTEGRKEECRNRNRNIAPMHFVDEAMDTSRLWESVDGYIQQAYCIEGLKEIVIHGDGGGWIRNGLKDYPFVVHAMDGYHLGKRTRALSLRFPGKSVKSRMYAAIAAGDRKQADRIVQDLIAKAEDEKSLIAAKEYGTYITNHFDGIRERLVADLPGSCTEGLVSHVLSERFSRNPMGWSKAGVGKLSKLRVYVLNGGTIHASAFQNGCRESYSAYSQRMINELTGKKYDWSMYENEPKIFDGNSGTQRAIRKLGKLESVS